MIRIVNAITFVIAGALAFLAFELSFETQQLEQQASHLSKEIEREKEAISILRAEWSYLSRPARLEVLASELLQMSPADLRQIMNEKQFAAYLESLPGFDPEPGAEARTE